MQIVYSVKYRRGPVWLWLETVLILSSEWLVVLEKVLRWLETVLRCLETVLRWLKTVLKWLEEVLNIALNQCI